MGETQIHVKLLSVSSALFDGNAAALYARNELGDFEIRHNHDTLASLLSISPLTIVLPDGSKELFAVHGGLIEVKDSEVLVLADAVEPLGDIDESRARSSLERADSRLALKQDDAIDRDRAASARDRALLRLMLKSKGS